MKTRHPRTVLLLVAVVASLIACAGPGVPGAPAPALDPYAIARSNVMSPLRTPVATPQDVQTRTPVVHEARRMCMLRGDKGAC